MLVLVIGSLAGASCGEESPSRVLPTAPTAVVPPDVAITNGSTLSGIVFDTANRRIAGARIEVIDGAQAGMTTTANASGQYWLTGFFEEGTRFRATKDGYFESVRPLGPSCAPCNPHLWVYFYLGSPVTPANIAGSYTMTVEARQGCNALPPEMRTRSYAATIVAEARQPTAADTYFRVDISGVSLLHGYSWEGLSIFVAGDFLELQMGDLHGQPGFVEELGDDTYFSVGAWGTATIGSPAAFTVPFEGDIVHCVMKPGAPPISDRRYVCSGAQVVTRVVCPAGGLTFTRR